MENRQHERIALQDKGWHAELIDQVAGNKLGDVVNISSGGLMLITTHPIETESLYQVECITTGPDGQSGQFTAGVVVLWRTEASQHQTYWAGLQIIDIDDASQTKLLALSAAMAGSGRIASSDRPVS